jgi:hypothetical protein
VHNCLDKRHVYILDNVVHVLSRSVLDHDWSSMMNAHDYSIEAVQRIRNSSLLFSLDVDTSLNSIDDVVPI